MTETASPAKNRPRAKTKVLITYNGRVKKFPYRKRELVGELLRKAIAAFEIVQNQHLLSLFADAGNELNDDLSLADAGVEAGDELILRQSIVKGG